MFGLNYYFFQACRRLILADQNNPISDFAHQTTTDTPGFSDLPTARKFIVYQFYSYPTLNFRKLLFLNIATFY